MFLHSEDHNTTHSCQHCSILEYFSFEKHPEFLKSEKYCCQDKGGKLQGI